MDAGQMIMMSQLPTGAGATAAKPAPSAAVALPAGEQQGGGNFAEMLLGASPSVSASSAATPGAVKAQIPASSGTAEETAGLMQAELQPDITAMLLAAAGFGMTRPAASNTDGKQELSPKQNEQEMPATQNVSSWAAGAQMFLSQPDNGRMPETGEGEHLNGGAGSLEIGVAGGTLSLNGMGMNIQGMLVDSGALPSRQLANSTPLEEGMARAALVSELPASPLQMEGVALPEQPGVTGQKSTAMAFASMGTPAQMAAASGTGRTLSGVNGTPDSGRKQEVPASRITSKAETGNSPLHVNAAAEQSEAGLINVADAVEANKDQFRVVDSGKGAGKQHEVLLPRSAAVEALLAGNTEKPALMAGNGLKAGLVPQAADGTDGLADGSVLSGNEFEVLLPKFAEAPTAATQQTQVGHQQFTLEALSPVSSQPAQADAPRTVSHEQVASQVREQLVSHDLKPGRDQITFKLSPEHLGDIKVNLTLQDQSLKVEIVAENRAARDSLLQHADALKDSLARQNISIEKFDVTSGGSGSGGQGNNAHGEWRELARNRQSQQWLSSGGYRAPQVEAVPTLAMYRAQTEHSMVDLHF